MKTSSRFTVAVHIISVIALSGNVLCTSDYIAGSVNTNPVVIRRLIGKLKAAGIVNVHSGAGGAYLQKELSNITLLDIYQAVETVEAGELFRFHETPNLDCPIGANIQLVLEAVLLQAQSAMEGILAGVTMADLTTKLIDKIK